MYKVRTMCQVYYVLKMFYIKTVEKKYIFMLAIISSWSGSTKIDFIFKYIIH